MAYQVNTGGTGDFFAPTFGQNDWQKYQMQTGWNGDSGYEYSDAWRYTGQDPFWQQLSTQLSPLGGGSMGNSNYMLNFNPETSGLNSLMIKSGDKQGTVFDYALNNGQYSPTNQANQMWDTNSSFQNSSLLKMLTLALGSAAMQGAGVGAEGAVQGAEVGTSLGGPSGLPAGFDSMGQIMQGATGGTPLAQGLGTGFGGVGATTGTLSSILPTGAAMGGLGALSGVGSALDIPGALGSLGGAAGAGGGGQQPGIIDTIKKLLGGGGGGSGGAGGGGNIGSLLAALYGAYSNNQSAQDMKGLIDRREGQMQPFYDSLKSLYDNPQGWLDGPEAQAMRRIDENRLLRTDSKRGNLGNDLPRSAALQDRMMGHLNQEKQNRSNALQPFMDSTNRLNDMFMMASMMKNSQFNPLFNQAGNQNQGGGGTGIEDIISGIMDLFGEDS